MTTNRTPGPWVATHRHPAAKNDAEIVIEQEGGSPPVAVVHDIYTLAPGGSHRHANAAFIVRAVNAHDELVAALRDLSDAVATDRAADAIPGLYQYVAKARAALAKVTP